MSSHNTPACARTPCTPSSQSGSVTTKTAASQGAHSKWSSSEREDMADFSRVGSRKGERMAIEIFWGSGSPYAWRVLLMLAVKGASYESRLLSFMENENHTPEYLKLSPRGRVPAMRDGDVSLSE